MAALALLFAAAPAQAARPLLDSGKWDNYFALFARDALVPWKRVSVRLDTFSGAGVDFAAYDVEPADVLVAGARPRPLDTTRRTPVAKWKFTPPAGLRFTTNDVEVPLKDKEGFYVIEARRGDAVQQVWLNLSKAGLIAKETPGGTVLYGADLGNGRALAGMRITYLVGTQFTYDKTDSVGISHVPARARFAIAEWGNSKSFVSFLPQSQPPVAVVGVRADRAAVRAGESVRIVGFARKRSGEEYRPATGEVSVTLASGGRTMASSRLALDKAGAFNGELAVPADAASGDAVILASAGGASGGATIHVDATGDVALTIATPCSTTCPADGTIDVSVTARRAGTLAAGQELRVRIVRSPHILPPGTPADAPQWGTTTVADQTLRSDEQGVVKLTIPAPTDGLASTYGVEASAGSATTSTRLTAPVGKIALSILADRPLLDVNDAVTLTVRAFDALDGSPSAGLSVHVALAHGPSAQEQNVTLGADGTADVTFRNIALGMNLASADADVDGRRVLDVSAVSVTPSALSARPQSRRGDVRIALDRPRNKPGDRVTITASLNGAVGDALVTMESARGVTTSVVPTRNGNVQTALAVPEAVGAISIGIAFVRDGALVDASALLVVDGPGHQRILALAADRATYAPGATAKITINDGDDRAAATVAIRVSDRRAGRGAAFDDVAGVLATSGTTTQNLSSEDPPWHAYVAPARSTAGDIFGFDRPQEAGGRVAVPMATASERVLVWKVDRIDRSTFEIQVPGAPGRYVLAIVKVTDDGNVGTASLPVTVQ